MAFIKIRGVQEFKEISNEEAKDIQKMLQDNSIPSNAKIGAGFSIIEKGSIVAVMLDEERSDREAKWQEKMEEFNGERLAWMNLSAEQKAAKACRQFEMWYQAINGKLPEKQITDKAEIIAHAFFKENIYQVYCNPKLWKELLGQAEEENLEIIMERVNGLMRKGIIRLLAQCYEKDCYEASYFKNRNKEEIPF